MTDRLVLNQTKYLIETCFMPLMAAWSLGVVSVTGSPGQISLDALSDRVGREWVWTVGCAGFAIFYAALIALRVFGDPALLYLIVVSQEFLVTRSLQS